MKAETSSENLKEIIKRINQDPELKSKTALKKFVNKILSKRDLSQQELCCIVTFGTLYFTGEKEEDRIKSIDIYLDHAVKLTGNVCYQGKLYSRIEKYQLRRGFKFAGDKKDITVTVNRRKRNPGDTDYKLKSIKSMCFAEWSIHVSEVHVASKLITQRRNIHLLVVSIHPDLKFCPTSENH